MKLINTVSSHVKTLEDLIPLSRWAEPSIKIVREHMTADPGHDESHLVRVARNALWFGENGDPDVIIPAAILHDLVNVPKSSPDRSKASQLSADKAIYELSSVDLSLKIGAGIYHAIVAHSFSANIEPETIEAKAVQDADRIEALGHIGWVRLFAVSGAMGRPLFHPTDPLAEHRELDEYAWGLDHFATKLRNLHTTMQTPIGQELAKSKTMKMAILIRNLVHEIQGTAPPENGLDPLLDRALAFANMPVD